ncbi:MAG: hypothetical protein LBL01_03580 [Bifidobacteriaceae bacterium]|jgi:hypothetical protein|nr:hypothetical protein [Bifidobacteriaceae bacterium]
MSGQNRTAYLALALVLVLALAAGAYFLLYAPLLEERSQANDSAAMIEAENEAAELELKQLQGRQEKLPELQEQLAAAQAEFPSGLELAQFTNYLAELVEKTTAEVDIVTPQDPVQLVSAVPLPAGPDDEPGPVIAQPPSSLYQYQFSIEIRGTWAAVNDYVTLLQGDNARIFMVTQVATKSVDELSVDPTTATLAYTIQGYTYALVPADALPVKPQEASNTDEQ